MMLRAGDQFHVGIVVEDFEATMAELSSLYGYEWCPETGAPLELKLPTGDAVVDIRCAYSKNSPRIEIIRSVPGTLWEPVAGSRVHHVGYWSDDVAAGSAELERHGYIAEAARVGPDGTLFFAFYRSMRGFRVELLTRAAQSPLEQYWAGS